MTNRPPMKTWKVLLLTLVALAVLFAVTIPIFSKNIESSVGAEVGAVLEDKAGEWASFRMDGRNVVLLGDAPDEAEKQQAEEWVAALSSVNKLDSEISIAEIRLPYVFSALFDGKKVTLSGFAETENEKLAILREAREAFVGRAVEGSLELYPHAPEGWLTSVGTALHQLARLNEGKLTIEETDIRLEGGVKKARMASAVRDELEALSKDDYLLDFDVMVLESAMIQKEDGVAGVDCQQEFQKLLLNDQILFSSGRTSIRTRSFGLLEKLLEVSYQCQDSHIVVAGFTDSRGGRAINKQLSLERAAAVVKWLVDKGLSRERLTAIGYGEQNPVATNATPVGRALNRRIEFTVRGE